MKDVARYIIVKSFFAMLVMTWKGILTDSDWYFAESPRTGICYELRQTFWGFGGGMAMSPVDSKWCEDEP